MKSAAQTPSSLHGSQEIPLHETEKQVPVPEVMTFPSFSGALLYTEHFKISLIPKTILREMVLTPLR